MSVEKYNKALEYEIFVKKEYGFLDNIIKSSKIIFDIWGHIWLFSKYCLSLNPAVKIYFFEPTDNIFLAEKILKAVNAGENFESQIFFFKKAVWEKNWKLNLFLEKNKTMQTSHYNSFLNFSKETQSCDMVGINDIFENIEKIDLLKLDIEWMEFEVLLALQEKNLKKIKNIIYEFHLFDKNFENQHQRLLERRKNLWKNPQVLESSYTKKIGYVLL